MEVVTKKILFLFPNTFNIPIIPSAIAIFSDIAKRNAWNIDYFDTYAYKRTQGGMEDYESSGMFKPSDRENHIKFKPSDDLVPSLQNKINTFAPNIIAISCISCEYKFLLTFLPDILIPKETLIIIGGIHPTLEPDRVAESGLFDLVCVGEGERVFTDILSKFEKGNNLINIKSTYFSARSSGVVIKNPRRRLIDEKELWKYIPDNSLFDEEYFLYPFDGKVVKRYSFELARGCPYDCTYCGSHALKEASRGLGRFVRTRPIESIKETLKKVVDNYNLEFLSFRDECFFSHRSAWLRELAVWYGQEIKKPFKIQARPENITEEKLELIKQMNAPFFQVSVGVESGSEKILKLTNRRIKIRKVIDAFDLMHKHDIRTCAFFMIGFPYETRKDIFESIKLCREIKPDIVVVSIFQPLPGTKLREICIRENYITEDASMPTTFTRGSILKMPQISSKELLNLERVFVLYAMLPEEYYSEIFKCEKDFFRNKKLHKRLINLRWSQNI